MPDVRGASYVLVSRSKIVFNQWWSEKLSDCCQLKLLLHDQLDRILIWAHLNGNKLICRAGKDAIVNQFTQNMQSNTK